MDRIYFEAEQAAKKYGTRDPYELLDGMGAILEFSYDYKPDGLKGFAAIINSVMYVVVNGHLNEHDRRIVVGHEAAHLILHRSEILRSPAKAMKDFNLYCKTGRLEHQANHFLADFLVSDEEALDVIQNGGGDYFHTASTLYLPPELLAFKLYSLMQRGYSVRNPVDLKSDFLRS